jgi:hypothetical protein
VLKSSITENIAGTQELKGSKHKERIEMEAVISLI